MFRTQYRERNFRDNPSFSGTIWAKAVFRDPSGTQVRNSGLSRRFRDSWQLCNQATSLLLPIAFLHHKGISIVLCNWASEVSPTLGCSIEITRDISGPEEAQGLQRFWPLHHLAFKFLNLTCHVMCSLHELLCILLIMSCYVLLVCHELCKPHIILILY